jgi:hypothetical protein
LRRRPLPHRTDLVGACRSAPTTGSDRRRSPAFSSAARAAVPLSVRVSVTTRVAQVLYIYGRISVARTRRGAHQAPIRTGSNSDPA